MAKVKKWVKGNKARHFGLVPAVRVTLSNYHSAGMCRFLYLSLSFLAGSPSPPLSRVPVMFAARAQTAAGAAGGWRRDKNRKGGTREGRRVGLRREDGRTDGRTNG